MLSKLLYFLVGEISKVHTYLMGINDSYEYNFSDKQLHFLVIGLLGMAMVFVIQPIFKLLAETGHTLVITWIYVFTVIIVITFAIEIGQKITNTGAMEFSDIMFGVVGFLFMFMIYAIIRGIIIGIAHLIQSFAHRD